MNIFTIAFFGHRDFNRHLQCEKTLEVTIKNILDKYDYVYFLVGKNGEFDQFVTSVIHRIFAAKPVKITVTSRPRKYGKIHEKKRKKGLDKVRGVCYIE